MVLRIHTKLTCPFNAILECGGRAQRRHRFGRFTPAVLLTRPKAVSPVAVAPSATALQKIALLALAILATALHAAADAAPPASPAPIVKQLPLDERIVYEIPISAAAPTTLMFPSAPSALEGANITANPDAPAPVLLSYVQGRYYFSVRAITPDARAVLNVILKNRTYILRFAAAQAGSGVKPFGSVTFYEDRPAGATAGARSAGAAINPKRATPDALLALLDRAKNYRLIQQQYPEAVQQIEMRAPNDITRYRDFTATVDEVYRFDAEDALVFKITLRNFGDTEVVYQPQSLAVRIGSHLYPTAIADASGLIPPRAETTAYFAICGNPDGSRANLSLKNSFNIIVPRVTRDAQLIAPK